MENPPIVLKKVRVHNLQGVDLTLESGTLIVFTGVSGSGKSSLAFDTIYIEGQRRYLESLSHQARRELANFPKPDAESITGIAPTIAIEQKQGGNNPRSTVGTMTGIYDFLRVLYAKVGVFYCPISKERVATQSLEKIIARIQMLPQGTKFIILSPYARGKKAEFKEDFETLLSKGFMRLRVDGQWVELGEIDRLDASSAHNVDIVIDRLMISEENRSRIAESIKLALEIGKGVCSIWLLESKEEMIFSEYAYSPKSGLSYGPLDPQDFSFNHPAGMCPKCHGLGICTQFDLGKIIDPNLSIAEDCCKIGGSYKTIRYGNIYNNLAKIYKFNIHTPWKDLSEKQKEVFLYGTEKKWTKMQFVHPEKKSQWIEFVHWKGVIAEANERLYQAKSEFYRKHMAQVMKEGICPDCHGDRIKPYPAAAEVGGKKISELTAMTLLELQSFFQILQLSELDQTIAEELLKEIMGKISFLVRVGVHYLSLDRTAPSLSGGESQRVRLAAQIGTGLVGAIYILDEPSIGLHPVDHHKLIHTLKALRDQGNTVLVVEHDADTILAADSIVDVGPGAGSHGGKILVHGSVTDLVNNPNSLTGAYLSGKRSIESSSKRRSLKEGLIIKGATHHNLKNIDVQIPLGGLVAITGVSGSGKSSLISDILVPSLSNQLHHSQLPFGSHKKIENLSSVDKIIAVDQSPIGRTPRSNAATYIKLLDDIRDLFTELPESKIRGFTSGHFSFNVKGGSCPYCGGLGQVKVDMDFLEDAILICPQCKGKRFDPEILSVLFRGKNIYDILKMDVESALLHFEAIPAIRKKLEILLEVGLSYLPLGQPSTTLSGGEAQRIKLAKELVRPSTGNTLYVLDEPTTGLHFHDIHQLITILHRLVEKGNTALVIEHNMDLVKTADWVIELGPEAGNLGGQIIAEGTPEMIAKMKTPTGIALKNTLRSLTSTPILEKKGESIHSIRIENAKQNNLKGIHLEIPRGKITVFTGPSGSGKTSLAFDTIYAEGQRRYTETLPAYLRQFIKQLPKPKVDRIEGLSPSIALEQKTGGLNPRSTVGTLTETYDLLRIIYAYLGTAYDPETGDEIRHISKEYVVQRILEKPEGEKITILTPINLQKKESFDDLVNRFSKQGFLRIRINGIFFELDQNIPFEKHRKNELFLVIDRMTVHSKNEKRLYEAVEKATQMSDGIVVVAGVEDLFFNLAFAVEKTGKSYAPITPQTFSFNAQAGMCQECQGLGMTYGAHFENKKQLFNESIFDITTELFKEKAGPKSFQILEKYFGKTIDLPLKKNAKQEQDNFFNGGQEKKIKGLTLKWLGIQPVFANYARMSIKFIRESLLPFLKTSVCLSCQGARLGPLARNVRIQNHSIDSLCNIPLVDALAFIKQLTPKPFLQEAFHQILKSLEFLCSIDIGYLSLNRSAPTLSRGELQRIRLAKQLGSGLTSCLYILDEPTIGLHPYNNQLLNHALKKLCKLGNTLLLVEHDPLTILESDFLVDFGPKAGKEGGEITATGTIDQIMENPNSLTGLYLSGKKKIPIPKKRRPFSPDIRIENASLHNLANLSLSFAKGAITCITGVSGSGKSTLMRHLLKPAAEKALHAKEREECIEFLGAKFYGLSSFEQVISIDQTPIGQTSRADVSTYTDIQPLLRAHWAAMPKAVAKGLQPRHFSPNHKRGMCKNCLGLGYKMIDLQFLPSVQVPCDSCRGLRLNPISLEVEYKGKNLGQVLEMTVEEAIQWFEAIPRIVKRLSVLSSVGLSYLQLGQEIASLSGGEAQRIRLSRELAKRDTGKNLYLIDEPTVGLHSEDIAKLLPIFHSLANKKNTLILIEHNLDCVANADYIIDLGPGAGVFGGQIVAQGTPEEVALSKNSKTALFLKDILTL